MGAGWGSWAEHSRLPPDCGQGCGVKLVPLGTLGTHQGQAASANHVSAVGTLTPRTLMPVIPTRGNACAAYTTQRGRTVPTASLASMGRLPDRAVTVSVEGERMVGVGLCCSVSPSLMCSSWLAQAVPATCWAQIPSSAHPLTGATVTQAVGSAHASPMSRALPVTAVPPTSGILPVALAASPVPATQVEPEDPPAMRYGSLP